MLLTNAYVCLSIDLKCSGEGVSVASGLIVLNSIVLPHKDITANVVNEILL